MNKLKTFCETLFYSIVTWVLYAELWLLIGLAALVLVPTAALQGLSAAKDIWGMLVNDVIAAMPSPKEVLKKTKEAFEEASCKSKK